MQIEIDPVDAAIVKAILLTHASIQDRRVMETEVIQTRLMRDEPGETLMIDTLASQVVDFEEDSEELRRIANIFPALM